MGLVELLPWRRAAASRCGLHVSRPAEPAGLHRATLRRIAGRRLRIGPIEAIDGTPAVDIKPVLDGRLAF
jgi:tRNA (Thr-GGU) A37 N-methylase